MGNGQESLPFLRSGKANFSLEKFNAFWNDNASLGFYIVELIKYYNEIEKTKKVSGISIENTISTLYFLILSGWYDPTDQDFQTFIEDGRQRWEFHRQNHDSYNPLIDEIMTSILNLPSNPDDHIHLVFNHSLTFAQRISTHADISFTNYFGQQHKAVNSQEILAYQSKGFVYLSLNPKFCILERPEFILTYIYIKNYLTGIGFLPVSILDLFHRKIQEMIINLRSNDFKPAQSCLLPLLHMLENILIRFPVISYDSMDVLIIDLDILRRWPVPYGAAAHKVLNLILKELKSPGSAMRYRIRDDYPIIDVHVPVFESHNMAINLHRKATGFIVLDSSETMETSYFYRIAFFNKKHRKEKILEMIEKIEGDSPINLNAIHSHVNRCLIILFTFSLYTEIQTPDLSHIAGLSTESVFGLYKRIIQMIDKIDNEEMDRARTLQEWFILELFEEVKSLKSDRTNPLTEPLFVYLSEFEIFFPRLPLHSISIIDLTHVESSPDAHLDTYEGISRAINDSEASVSDDPIIDILQQSINIQESSHSFPVKIILTGSDSIIHRFVRNYVKLLVTNKISSEFDIRFFSVPTFQLQNTMSMYLASIDSWYTRHIYIPFFTRPWLPRLDTKVDIKAFSKKDAGILENLMRSLALDPPENGGLNEKALPIVYSEMLLQDYLSEAKHIISVNIYKVKCYQSDLSFPAEIIPMCMYIDIGVLAAVKRLQDLNASFKEKTVEEVMESKAFRFKSLSLQIQMHQMDLLGHSCGIDESVIKNIYSLSIGNVPRENDKCIAPIPQAEWLELTFIERDAAELESTLVKGIKNKKTKDPQSQANIAINSLYSNLHVSGGKVMMSESGEMDIIVDGELYGPFKQIIIEPWIGDDSVQLSMPIYTYYDCEP